MQEFCQAWDIHKLMTRWMWRLFMHLDNGYICNMRTGDNSKFNSLTSYSLLAFHDIVYSSVKTQICSDILQAVEDSRKGNDVSLEYVQQSVEVSHFLSIMVNSAYVLMFVDISVDGRGVHTA
jgi:hypothetical protein